MTEDLQPAPLSGESDLPDALRRVARGLVLDLRALGFRDQPENHRELLKAELRAVQNLLDADDPRLAERGLQALHAIQKERRRVAELEIQHAKTGIEALIYLQLSRLRMQGEQPAQGPSSENVSAALSQMVAELSGQQDKADDSAPSPEVEPEPGPGRGVRDGRVPAEGRHAGTASHEPLDAA